MIKIVKKPKPAEQSPQAKPQGELLLVDDEETLLALLERLFKTRYNVKIADSGEAAIELLKSGYKPEVIFSDQRMPGMNGAEFLKKSHEYVPDAVRVILTGYTDVNDIIASINEGHAYKFLTKPWNNEDLLLTAKNCFDYYNLQLENKRLYEKVKNALDEVKKRNEALVKLNDQIKTNLLQTVRTLSGIISAGDNYYYNNHSQTVAIIARAIAGELNLEKDAINNVIMAGLLHNIGTIGMSEKILAQDPEEMDSSSFESYIRHIEKGASIVRSISGLEKVSAIISQYMEKYDGTGVPLKLEANQIYIESQIISIANIYNNKVHKIPRRTYFSTENPDKLTQNEEEIELRQAEAIHYISRHPRWFSFEVHQAFLNVAKKGKCPPLQMGSKAKASFKLEDETLGFNPLQKQKKVYKEVEEDLGIAGARKVSIDKVQIGMISAKNIVTNNGLMAVPKGTVVDFQIFEKLQDLNRTETIPKSLWFFDP